ncbi:MAG: hypothetical protein WCW35_10195 [Bacteroidota bacterium]
MTPKQIARLQKKISDIKWTLADEKRKYGCYDDSRGIRYVPPRYFIQLGDYSGGLKYLNWFAKNFPDDSGFPDFLFEWTIILYKTGKLREAEKKAFKTFCANTYLFDKFYGKPIKPIIKWEGSNLEEPSFAEHLQHNCNQHELKDFSEWLNKVVTSDKFITSSKKIIEINKRLKKEEDRETRHYLIMHSRQLLDSF